MPTIELQSIRIPALLPGAAEALRKQDLDIRKVFQDLGEDIIKDQEAMCTFRAPANWVAIRNVDPLYCQVPLVGFFRTMRTEIIRIARGNRIRITIHYGSRICGTESRFEAEIINIPQWVIVSGPDEGRSEYAAIEVLPQKFRFILQVVKLQGVAGMALREQMQKSREGSLACSPV